MARPFVRRADADDIAVALARASGRRHEIAVEDRELDDRVERGQRLVVGDVLLRLFGDEKRQAE